MLKFFRGIRQKLIREGNLTRYLIYAVGEILLVVIGILIALQINNWNEYQKSKIQEANFLLELNKEFKENRIQFQEVVSQQKKVLKSCNEIIKLFPISIEEPVLDTLSKYLNRIQESWTFDPSQGTINSIVNTASFQILENEELRKLLISWNDVIEDFQEEELIPKKFLLEEFDPYQSQHFDFELKLDDTRINLEVLQTLQFEYMIKRRADDYALFIDQKEFKKVQSTIDRIIELTEKK